MGDKSFEIKLKKLCIRDGCPNPERHIKETVASRDEKYKGSKKIPLLSKLIENMLHESVHMFEHRFDGSDFKGKSINAESEGAILGSSVGKFLGGILDFVRDRTA